MSLLNDFLEMTGHYKVAKEIAQEHVARLALSAGYSPKNTEKVVKGLDFSNLKEISQRFVLEATSDPKNSRKAELIEALTYLPDMVQFLNSRPGKNFLKLFRTVSSLDGEAAIEWIAQAPEVKNIRRETKPRANPFSRQSSFKDEGLFEDPLLNSKDTAPDQGGKPPGGISFLMFGSPDMLENFKRMLDEDPESEDF